MSRGRWHVLHEDGGVIVARHLPVRFDIEVISRFPPLDPGRLARQIRQDMWRTLKDLRGFSPVVKVTQGKEGVTVRAGGRVAGGAAIPSRIHDDLTALLSDPARRARWSGWAARNSRGRA